MYRSRVGIALQLLGSALLSMNLHAHGGVPPEFDECIVPLGRYKVHLTAYEAGKGDGYCHSIPEAGDTIIVFDFLENALRKKAVDVAIFEANGSQNTEDMKKVVHLPSRVYPAGTVEINADFQANKHYIAQVRLADNKSRVAQAEFHVGNSNPLIHAFISFVVLFLTGFTFLYVKKPELMKAAAKRYQQLLKR